MNIPEHITQAMGEALELGRAAGAHEDIPVGAVVLSTEGKIIGRGKNERELRSEPQAHAEVIALSQAAQHSNAWNLSGCQLVVTLEPCLMCTGLVVLSRISKVWWGAHDPKGGAIASTYGIGQDNRTNHKFEYQGGLCEEECAKLLKDFFARLRK